MLSKLQISELEALGSDRVRGKLSAWNGGGSGPGSLIGGFKSGDMLCGDIDEWLSSKAALENHDKAATLLWAKIAGWTGIATLVITLLFAIVGLIR